jgi:F-type H+-transporting ATPase subunit delta
MSREAIVAKRYAKALFELANEKGIASKVESQLKEVAAVIAANDDFNAVLNHPNIDAGKKRDLLKVVFGPHVDETVLNALYLLVDRKRETIVSAFVTAYVQIAQAALGQATAVVTSAKPLTNAQTQAIANQLKSVTGKTIVVEAKTDAKLIGGLTIQVNGTLYDGSISGQLERLQHAMRNNQAL